MNWRDKDKLHLWHPYTQVGFGNENVVITHARGAWLYDEDGNAILDAISSWWVNLHGHSNPFINLRIAEQLERMEQVIFAGYSHPPAIQLAEKLLGVLPWFDKVFYSDNGSTAVEVALKMAVQFKALQGKKSNTFLSFENAYHGDTFGAMAVSGRSLFTSYFEDMLFDIKSIPTPPDEWNAEYEMRLEEILSNSEIAGFIYEPLVQGSGGMLMHRAKSLEKLLLILKNHGVLLIADEVMTGFGRTGELFASNALFTKPDLMCLSKGLTGGYLPMGVTLATKEIHDAFISEDISKALFHGHSYTANPLACAAGLASFELLTDAKCLHRIGEISKQQEAMADSLRDSITLKNPRSCGTILAADVVTDSAGYGSPVRKKILAWFATKKILIRPLGNVIYILPPYCITDEELEFIHSSFHEFKL